MASKLIFVLLLISATQANIDRDILSLYLKKFKGEGTYYGSGVGALCQYAPPHLPPLTRSPVIKATAALNKPQFHQAFVCGMCFKVIGNGTGYGITAIKGDFVVFVDDLCPSCKEGDIDLAQFGDGRWNVEIRAVQCPVGNTTIEYKFQGSNQFFIKFQIRNARIPVTRVRLHQQVLDTWSPLKHTIDGFWCLKPGYIWQRPIRSPLHVELTAANGERFRDIIPKIANDVVIPGLRRQFLIDPKLPSA